MKFFNVIPITLIVIYIQITKCCRIIFDNENSTKRVMTITPKLENIPIDSKIQANNLKINSNKDIKINKKDKNNNDNKENNDIEKTNENNIGNELNTKVNDKIDKSEKSEKSSSDLNNPILLETVNKINKTEEPHKKEIFPNNTIKKNVIKSNINKDKKDQIVNKDSKDIKEHTNKANKVNKEHTNKVIKEHINKDIKVNKETTKKQRKKLQKGSFNYFTVKTNELCSYSNCNPRTGNCIDKNICQCSIGYADISFITQQPADRLYCTYQQKNQLTAFLLEFVFGIGIGHFYAGRVINGLLKFLLFGFILPCSVCCLTALIPGGNPGN